MNSIEQQFFNALEAKLWTAANKLLPSLDAAVYKHIVLGLLFIKYVSDAFEERQKELKPAATGTSNSIEDLLRAPAEAQQVEPGRIPLIAQELAKVIAANKVVDWDKREAVQAQMRTAIRVLLRKYGYPPNVRELVAEQVLALAKQTPAEPA